MVDVYSKMKPDTFKSQWNSRGQALDLPAAGAHSSPRLHPCPKTLPAPAPPAASAAPAAEPATKDDAPPPPPVPKKPAPPTPPAGKKAKGGKGSCRRQVWLIIETCLSLH